MRRDGQLYPCLCVCYRIHGLHLRDHPTALRLRPVLVPLYHTAKRTWFRVLLAVLMLGGGAARADHFSGASITYECIGTNMYDIYLDMYLDCSGAPITPQTLYFENSCGVSFSVGSLTPLTVQEVSPLCPSQISSSTCNGGALPSFRKYRFKTTLYLSPCNFWKIYWYICCRNTMQNIQLTPGLYVEATLDNESGLCDASPRFVDTGIPYVCVNQPIQYNPGVSDANGHTMVFSLISARYGTPAPTPVTYFPTYTGAQPFVGISLNAFTGQLSFTPTTTGYYTVVIKVTTYTSGGVLIGSVMRDLMFAVITCSDVPPAIAPLSNPTNGIAIAANSFYACQGQSFCVDIMVSDNTGSAAITITSNAATVLPGSTFTVTGTNPARATLCWTANTSVLPQTMFIQASDNACPIANVISTFLNAQPCSVLPIELLSFNAETEFDQVIAEWTTGTERGSDYFTVERSLDRTTFEAIGRVEAAGESQEVRDYRFVDPAPHIGTSYYRLRETDVDGTGFLSDVVSVDLALSTSVIATWNGSDAWSVGGAPAGAEWTLVDMTGRRVAMGMFTDEAAQRIPMEQARGLQLLLVQVNGQVQALKLPADLPSGATVGSAHQGL